MENHVEKVIKSASHLLRSLLRMTGMMWLWRSLHRNSVTIIKLHGVMDTGVTSAWVPLRPQLSRRRLEESIRVLARHYRFVSLQEAVEMLAGRKPLLPYSMAVTFDDGYRNCIKHALPILRRYGVSATIFISTGHVEFRKPFWFDRLDYAIQALLEEGREFRDGAEAPFKRGMDRDEIRRLYKHLRGEAKKRERPDTEMIEEMESMAARFESEHGRRLSDIFEEDDWSAVLTWDEIRRTSGADVCYGSHTENHLRLEFVDEGTIRKELTRSKEMIEEKTGSPCELLCFPNGSFNGRVVELAGDCGYTAAFTTVVGTNRVGDDLMTLKRTNIPANGSVADMLATVSGMSDWISRRISMINRSDRSKRNSDGEN